MEASWHIVVRRVDPSPEMRPEWSPDLRLEQEPEHWVKVISDSLSLVPPDGHWYEVGIVFSDGHATATRSRINEGIYGEDLQCYVEQIGSDKYQELNSILVRRRL